MPIYGPPPPYSETVCPSSANVASVPTPSDEVPSGAPIWTLTRPDLIEIVWPPSYAESQRINSSSSCDCSTRQNCQRHSRDNRNGIPATSARGVLRLPSFFRPPLGGPHTNNGSVRDCAMAFPSRPAVPILTERAETRATAATEGEHLVNPWADRVRDVFLSLLTRILLVFLFIVFTRVLIAQLSPNEE